MKERFIYSSNPCLNSSRVLNGVGRYPQVEPFDHSLKTAFSSALRNPRQAGLAYNSCATTVARVTSHMCIAIETVRSDGLYGTEREKYSVRSIFRYLEPFRRGLECDRRTDNTAYSNSDPL